MTLYAAVTPDKYELIISISDSCSKLAKTLNVHPSTIYYKMNGKLANGLPERKGRQGMQSRFFVRKIEMEDGD